MSIAEITGGYGVCACVHVCVCMHAYDSVRMCVCMHVCKYMCVCVRVCVCMETLRPINIKRARH